MKSRLLEPPQPSQLDSETERRIAVMLKGIDVRSLLVRGWQWWCGELGTFVPKKFLNLVFMRPRQRYFRVDLFGGELAVFSGVKDATEVFRSEAEAILSGDAPHGLSARLPLESTAGAVVAVRLSDDDFLRRRMEFPFAAGSNLQDILRFEVDHQSPLERRDIYFDHWIVQRDKAANRLAVELRIVRRQSVERAVALCRAVGLEPTVLGFLDDPRPFELQHVYSHGERPKRGRLHRWAVPGLAGLAALLAVAWLVIVLERNAAETDALGREVARAKVEALAVGRLRHEAEGLAARTQFLANAKRQVSLLRVVDEIARALPDGSWIFQLAFDGKEVRLHGFSTAAPTLIARLDDSPLFDSARFRAPLTEGPRPDLQRFELSIVIRSGAR